MKINKLDAILSDILKVSKTLDKHPSQLTGSEYSSAGKYTAADLWKCGGLNKIVKDNFYREEDQPDLSVVQSQKNRASYLKKLQRVVGDKEYLSDMVVAKLEEVYKKHPIPVLKTPSIKFNVGKGKRRENVAFLSDTHFGLRVDRNEVPANGYDWTVAARRMAKYAVQVATYKQEHRKDCPTLRVCLGGDLAQGLIHLSENGTDMLVHQLWGSQHIIQQMITYWLKHYTEIKVECTPDNHMRLTHKGPDRAMAQKFDSHATTLHLGLMTAFRNHKNVTFNIPKTPFTEFDVLGHKVFMTHGDTVLRSGYVGKSVDIAKISNAVRALQVSRGVKFDAILMGHVHVPLNTTLDNGSELIINGTASGTDSYAQSIGIMDSHPCQVLFESTEDYVVGDFRKVYLKDADIDPSYDKVVAPYRGSFTNPPG